MTNAARNNPWLEEIRDNRDARTKFEFDRDWLVLAAHDDRWRVTEIAEAAGITRQQAHRIIAAMKVKMAEAMELSGFDEGWQVYDVAWAVSSWDSFYQMIAGD